MFALAAQKNIQQTSIIFEPFMFHYRMFLQWSGTLRALCYDSCTTAILELCVFFKGITCETFTNSVFRGSIGIRYEATARRRRAKNFGVPSRILSSLSRLGDPPGGWGGLHVKDNMTGIYSL